MPQYSSTNLVPVYQTSVARMDRSQWIIARPPPQMGQWIHSVGKKCWAVSKSWLDKESPVCGRFWCPGWDVPCLSLTRCWWWELDQVDLIIIELLCWKFQQDPVGKRQRWGSEPLNLRPWFSNEGATGRKIDWRIGTVGMALESLHTVVMKWKHN